MRYLQNERGIALVMVLVFAMVGLAIVSGMLFMLTQGTVMSGANKMFRSADEAGLGGVNIAVDMVKNRGWSSIAVVDATLGNCLQDKLNLTRGWSTNSSNWLNCNAQQSTSVNRLSFDPTVSPDITRTLNGPAGTTFTMQAKIVDTVQGNTDVGGLVGSGQLGGTGVVASTSGQVTPPTISYLYRIEVQTQNLANPSEVSRYSALYAH